MLATQTFYQIDRLETMSLGDYSFVTIHPSGTVQRKSVIRRHGGFFYCFADKYEHYKDA